MAKTTKKKVLKTTAPLKEAVKETMKKVETPKAEPIKKAEVKEEPKQVVKKEPEKIAAKPEPKKIAAKKEPEKITAAKAPEKIAAKPEPKKIEEKTAPLKEPAKAVAKKAEKKPAVKKAEPKKTEAKKAEAPKAETKKETPKKAAGPIAAKTVSTKAVEKKKAEPKKAEVKKAAVKEENKKTAPKKTETKKAVKKAPAKKAVDKEKLAHYEALALEECIRLMQAMNVHYSYEDYYQLLLDEADLSLLEKNIIDGNKIKEMKLVFSEHGYDEDLVMVTLTKVADTMDIKAADYKDLKKAIQTALKFKFHTDGEVNAAEYLNEFALSEKILMIGQRKTIVSAKEVSEFLGADVEAYFAHFFDFAYALLPEWQYNDVKYYEDFAYAVLSQFADLFETFQLRIQIDVADLYIKHGDYQHGDELYSYILRDNQIKDYIYYRYASVYKDIDYNKAKSIAYSSLQFVDDRYTYYPNIMEIINN